MPDFVSKLTWINHFPRQFLLVSLNSQSYTKASINYVFHAVE
ncbi:hypothetical protein CFP56_009058 [Quercus suber]|uniref:Uncharacterized protein n=1 Tax=Quercus suber TaxID=58331 RepID=A0AAW0L1P5_QUESU